VTESQAGRIAAVTGASGYLGSRIAHALEANGWRVVRLVRNPDPGDPDERWFDAGKPLDPRLLESVDLLVHAAYDLTVTSRADIWRINVEGTRRLLRAAQDANVSRIIVLSSMSAYDGTTQLYGRAKLEIEALTFAAGGYAIRPGIVFGANAGGMAGALRRLTRLPLVPLVAGDVRLYLVSDVDLVRAVASFAEAETLASVPIGVAYPTPIRFRDFLLALAASEGRRPRFVPFPWRALYAILRAGESMRLAMPFRADSLLALAKPAPTLPGLTELERLGVVPTIDPRSQPGEAR
jgi:nucleoside-diphosphate-sugar epimerase